MAFVPASSLFSGAVTVAGTVAVTQSTSPWVVDGSAVTQPVSGTVGVSNFPAVQTVAVDNFPASQAVTGPLTDAQLRASAIEVDGSATTQPVSADELPLPEGAASEHTLSDIALTAILQRDKLEAA